MNTTAIESRQHSSQSIIFAKPTAQATRYKGDFALALRWLKTRPGFIYNSSKTAGAYKIKHAQKVNFKYNK